MSTKIRCYLRTHRRAWGLTQKEMASLLGSGDRNRVSRVERDMTAPNGWEILAYSLVFGSPAPKIFPRFFGEAEDAVMRGAYRLMQRLEKESTPGADRKRELIHRIAARAREEANRKQV